MMRIGREGQGPVGVLMLDTDFPRPPGDIGNAVTFGCAVMFRVVDGADAPRVVRGGADGLVERFVDAARELEAQGARAITTSCGFLVLHQARLAAVVSVPVVTSSLLLLPHLEADEVCGVVTIDAESLGRDHLAAAGAQPDTPIIGVDPNGHFAQQIMGDRPTLDADLARADIVSAARTLIRKSPEITAILLECTNMAPHADAVAQATRRRVFSICDTVNLLALDMTDGVVSVKSAR